MLNFQDFWNKFSSIFWQLCDKETCAFVVMGIGKKVMWTGGGMGFSNQHFAHKRLFKREIFHSYKQISKVFQLF